MKNRFSNETKIEWRKKQNHNNIKRHTPKKKSIINQSEKQFSMISWIETSWKYLKLKISAKQMTERQWIVNKKAFNRIQICEKLITNPDYKLFCGLCWNEQMIKRSNMKAQ